MTYRSIITELRRLKIQCESEPSIGARNLIDRQAADVAANCYHIMGERYFDIDPISGRNMGLIYIARLSQHYCEDPRLSREIKEWKNIRLSKKK